MGEVRVDYVTLARCEQVLRRQEHHAQAMERYVRAHTDISDSTGAVLSVLAPLSAAAVEIGALAARGSGVLARAAADGVASSAQSYLTTDRNVSQELLRLGRAVEQAAADHGSADSWLGPKITGLGDTLGDAVDGLGDLGGSVRDWGRPSVVREAVDASSYLVAPQQDANWVMDLRWNAGVLLGSVDWVAEQLIGISILAECVFKPLGGDWRALEQAAEGWTHAGEAAFALGRNTAALASGSVDGWQGQAGDAFRAAMGGASLAYVGLSEAYDLASGLVDKVVLASKLACAGIGMYLKHISQMLVETAAEMAAPVIGWAVAAAKIWGRIEKVIAMVRLVYSLIEALMDLVVEFVEAKTALLDRARLVEDLAETLARRSGAMA